MTGATVSGTSATYVYRGDRLRHSKTVSGNTTTYTWDVNDSLPVILQDGTYTYVYGHGLISPTDGSGVQSYFLSNGLGSTEALTDSSGSVIATYKYDVFGAIRSSGGSGSTEYNFTGQQEDATLGYTYLRARYYDPAIGRFISKDPFPGFIVDPTSLHYYNYVGNNPVNGTDPSGEQEPFGFLFRALGLNNSKFLFWDFWLGQGDTNRFYGPNTRETREMRKSPGAEALRNAFYTGGCNDVDEFRYGTWLAAWETVIDPSPDWSSTATQVGGFIGYAINNGNGTVTFRIENKAGAKSFFYHAVSDAPWKRGPMRTIAQIFWWTEEIN
ncbi:MAG: RHS repeat-associated core domain-containing protein [Chloroflexi bacterium]|nr:RHS repeat-associated core domain-containing protein [Chloroflexota bacterium]